MIHLRSCRPALRAAVVALGLAAAWGMPAPAARAVRAPADVEAASATRPARSPPAYVAHEVIVGYRPRGVMSAAVRSALGIRASTAAATPHTRILHLKATTSVTAAIARLRRQPGVAFAEPDYIAHAAGEWYPNDPGRSGQAQGWVKQQWNLLPGIGINATEAWANLFAVHRGGGRGVTIAVLDTGIAYRDWHQFHESPDFRGTRFVAPYDFIANNRYPLDRNGHGTFVAGVLGETTNNSTGLTGVAWGATIMPIRVLDAGGEGDEATIARGIRYAVQHHAQIINLSLEFLPSQVKSASEIPAIVSAIGDAHRHGVIVVGAAGNDQTGQIAYPARTPGAISVGATTRDRCLAAYSNGGSGLDLVAPGGGDDAIMTSDADCHPGRTLPSIYQLTLTNPPHWGQFGYPNYYIGTSMSSPEVAGAAALVISSRVIGRHPSPDQVLARLEQTATPLPALGPAPNVTFGYGLLNAGAATAPGPPKPTIPPTTPTTPTTTTTPTTPTTPTTAG